MGAPLTGQVVLVSASSLEAIGLSIVLKQAVRCDGLELAGDYAALHRVVSSATALVILDDHLAGGDLPEQIRILRGSYPHVKVAIVATRCGAEDVRPLLAAGIQGFIPKHFAKAAMIEALRMIVSGHIYMPSEVWTSALEAEPTSPAAKLKALPRLSTRQRQVLDLASQGNSNKEIARHLEIAEATVKVHLGCVFRTMGVSNRGRAVAAFREYDEAQGPTLLAC